jgi:lipopolysaccharide export system protein LptA
MTIPKRREKKVAASVSNRIRANGDLQQDPAWLRNFRVVQECGEVFGSCRVNVNVKKGRYRYRFTDRHDRERPLLKRPSDR